jgi:hypothetical protein
MGFWKVQGPLIDSLEEITTQSIETVQHDDGVAHSSF